MKKHFLVILISTMILALIIGGMYLNHSKKENYTQIQKKRIELYFQNNLKKFNSINYTDIKKREMGSYSISGYINGDKKIKFKALMDDSTNYQFDGILTYNNKLEMLFKHQNEKKVLHPSEIIKEKRLNKEDYEADPPLFF